MTVVHAIINLTLVVQAVGDAGIMGDVGVELGIVTHVVDDVVYVLVVVVADLGGDGVVAVDVVEKVLRLAASAVHPVQRLLEYVAPDSIARIARDARQVAIGWDIIVAVAYRRHLASRSVPVPGRCLKFQLLEVAVKKPVKTRPPRNTSLE